ncbi:Periplasmic divalent cation tolerance protein CutA [Granulibacter bethesdensis]|uniref:Periplasmic divalent cation tolerance protein CutA n=1 Tax=Granulibacter bethesdensis TaxID=364410 RepID=A0AAN0RDJ5_9PROT|nr:divalent-cation tolerance protein CutA [Granulibacter bethesdensis]AHJ62853.1 Periplasmic divalent cation tolerance protein CutA [Granulibacter bethesdensis]AHJ66582.1 Periplasmic divalent cation tolerance protein CutA [Granulibacter bethesdensis CGDNIH4]
MTEEKPVVVYATCADEEEARRIGRALIEAGLAACVNMRPHTAIYRWNGQIEEGAEFGLLIKTTASQQEAAMALIRQMHSYELPGILSLHVAGGDPAYLQWICDNTADEREDGSLRPVS